MVHTFTHATSANNYEKAFREFLNYGRFQGYEENRRTEKLDLMKGVEILELICARENITERSKVMIDHLSVLADKGHVSEGLLSMTIDRVMCELKGGLIEAK